MRLLLDTHAFLWFAEEDVNPFLPQATRELLEDGTNDLYLSVASVWEIAIKVSIGKLKLPEPIVNIVNLQISQNDIQMLQTKLTHFDVIETLPLHHKDPFDRMLAAQGLVENLTIVSLDAALDRYGVNRIWLE